MTIESRSGWEWRPKLRWFAAEFLVVATGVLVALALNAFYQREQEAKSEEVYLSLLSRDMQRVVSNLEQELAFEALQLRDGITAYRTISSNDRLADHTAASLALQRLTVRRTQMLQDVTYRDLISTGNLRLIENRELRDRVVDFFENTRLQFEIINKNNSFFVDELYNRTMVEQGLIVQKAAFGNLPALTSVDSTLLQSLGPGYIEEPDPLWRLPPDAREWAKVKSALVSRIRVAAGAQYFGNNLMKEARGLKTAIDAERARF